MLCLLLPCAAMHPTHEVVVGIHVQDTKPATRPQDAMDFCKSLYGMQIVMKRIQYSHFWDSRAI